MYRTFIWIALLALLAAQGNAQVEITALESTGALEWSNALPNVSVFDVEWSGSLTSGTWRASWDGLAGIPATAATCRVEVPMAYRVVARTNVLRSRWTLLFYMMADNNLETDFINKFVELGQWNSDTNVQLVVQFARLGDDARYGGWSGCERFFVTNGILPTQDGAVPDWGDGTGGRPVNMSDPATLAAFLDWAMLLHPADHTALFIGDHGFGWTGFGICDSYANSFMYLPELARVLQDARAPVDCLFMDACLMNMGDTVAEMHSGGAQYLLASETYGQANWPYGWMIGGLQANPLWTPREFATDANERLWTYYSETQVVDSITLCTSDLSLVPGFVSNTARFVSGLLDTNIPLAEVQDRARDTMGSISNLFVVRRLGPDWNGIAYGLSVYFPLKDGLYAPPLFSEYTLHRTGFARDANWQLLLDTYYDLLSHPPPHFELFSARAAITNCLGSDEYIDLYDFLERVSIAVEPE